MDLDPFILMFNNKDFSLISRIWHLRNLYFYVINRQKGFNFFWPFNKTVVI